MCARSLQTIYCVFANQEGARIPLLEQYIKCTEGVVFFSEDYLRNETLIYKDLFSGECDAYVNGLLQGFLKEMKVLTFDESWEVLEAVTFLQGVAATALWKFGCNLNSELESFVREFDRLDVVEERKRLYLLAQE